MPQEEICSYCYIERNEMMQRTSYSIYDNRYQSDLKYIHTRCAKTGPTDIPPPIITLDVPEDTACTSGLIYATKGGESCDSIALEYSVSSASLYMANQLAIGNCTTILPNLELCLPLPCAETYILQTNDTCTTIEYTSPYNLTFGDVRSYNPWISFGCENIQEASAFYGKVLCLSPQNGVYNKTGPSPGDTTIPTPATGYALVAVPPPDNGTVALGTTLRCGKWHQRVDDEQCVEICVREGIPFGLFREVNPSLDGSDCTASLKANITYCVGPTYDWNTTATTTVLPTTTPTATATATATSTVISGTAYSLPPAPTGTGTTPQCNSWYTVKNGDTCDTISSAYGISRSQLVIWNSYLDTACDNLSVGYSVCVSSPLVFQFWTSLGCYVDVTTSRTLANQIILSNQDTTMTVELCQQTCRSSGYTFAGLEYAHQCWCANSILNNGPATSGCSSPCPGNTAEICGGSDRINIYAIGNDTTVGCYVDSSISRTLRNRVSVPNEATIMTHQVCESACERAGYQISGVEYKSECYCDNSINGAVASSGCDMACAGNSNQICGGSNRITILTRPQSRYVGCYSDSATARTLVNRYSIANEGTIMTVDLCRNACRTAGYIYSGVEFGQQCFCDNAIQSTGVISTGCTMACAGNATQICGGSNRVSIYSL
jgi:LysM repeat protein